MLASTNLPTRILRSVRTAAIAALVSGAFITVAIAEARAGAWSVRHQWDEAIPGDPDGTTFAGGYEAYVRSVADGWVGDRERARDCADFSYSLMIDYAALHGLPVALKNYEGGRFVAVRSTDARFGSKEAYLRWALVNLGAQNLADNTFKIGYDEWRWGDMVLMDWNQTDTPPNYPGRTVWHTYVVGDPGKTAYWGTYNRVTQPDGSIRVVPQPITRITGRSVTDRLVEHPDRHGLAPRRWSFMRVLKTDPVLPADDEIGAGDEDEAQPETGRFAVKSSISAGNVRREPRIADGNVVGRVGAGDELTVIARAGRWLRLAGEQPRWVHDSLLDRLPDAAAASERAPAEGATDRIGGMLGSNR